MLAADGGLGMRTKWIALGAVIAAALGAIAWACADAGEEPTWALAKKDYDPGGGAGMLLPSNDTRINMFLLLADRRGFRVEEPAVEEGSPPVALFPWMVMERQTRGTKPGAFEDPVEPSRCQSVSAGNAAFAAALRANPNVPDADKQRLIAARAALSPWVKPAEEYMPMVCGDAKAAPLAPPAVWSPAGREFAAYLAATQSFYGGAFDRAADGYRGLASASDPWLRETALYMVARTLLNWAIDRSATDYGSIAPIDKRDVAGAREAGHAFEAYLQSYPSGRYARSARGLVRRAQWLAGDDADLAAEYGRQLSATTPLPNPAEGAAIVDEVDNKLGLPTSKPEIVRDPVLLAVVDLHRMRGGDAGNREWCCGPPITREEIERQRPLFGRDSELYDYVRAAEAYFVRDDPREVLQLLPDAARQKQFSYLQFSRQMLRGLALQQLGDRNARGFWLSLFPGATRPYQRPALELALAIQEERSGRLDLVFAPDSPVTHPVMRQMLLENVAGPDLLRQQATRPGAPKLEREVALYTLLEKELWRGFLPQFLGDLRLVPADAEPNGFYAGTTYYDARFNSHLDRPPLGKFGKDARTGNAGCPAMPATVAQLVAAPRAIRPRLCMAEYFRLNGFDDLSYEAPAPPVSGEGLATSREQFPKGRAYSRLEEYKAIMADPAASADDKALALNRAVRCYAPSRSNSCGGTDVALSVRRAWFNRLKAEYPQSRWAKELKYYW
jgi:hypothetical protein